MLWKKMVLPLGFNGQLNHDMYMGINSKNIMIQCVDAGGGNSEVLHGQRIEHWGMVMHQGDNRYEPTYQEKMMILRDIGIWKNCALEVMPAQVDVVDRENVYHIWEFQYPYSFKYNFFPILQRPQQFECEWGEFLYHLEQVGKVQYLYFKSKNGNEFGWKMKQMLKNNVIGYSRTAVEFIIPEMENQDYSALICLPQGEFLDFGLN